MTSGHRCFVIFAVVLALAFAPAPFPKTERRSKSISDMEGVWLGPHRMEITPTRMNFLSGAQMKYELRIDHAARPKTFDLKGVGNVAGGVEYKGIYRVEGDTLTVCYGGSGGTRPTEFNQQGCLTQVYKRVKN